MTTPTYSTGKINITAGNAVVVGVGTAFLTEARPNQYMVIPGLAQVFQVISVADDTHLTLRSPVPGLAGNTLWGLVYGLANDFTPTLSLPCPTAHSLDSNAQVVRALRILDVEIPNPV